MSICQAIDMNALNSPCLLTLKLKVNGSMALPISRNFRDWDFIKSNPSKDLSSAALELAIDANSINIKELFGRGRIGRKQACHFIFFLFPLPEHKRAQWLQLFCETQSNFLASTIHVSILLKKKLPDRDERGASASQRRSIETCEQLSANILKR